LSEFTDKIKKMQPILRTRKVQLDLLSADLVKIRNHKAQKLDELSLNQQAYINGVHRLNEERQSNDRSMLHALEHSIDHVKSLWHKCLGELRQIEQEERAQVNQIMSTQSELKAAETLVGRYLSQHQGVLKKREQKSSDEHALRKFIQNV